MRNRGKDNYQHYSASDFALDDSFIQWVVDQEPETSAFWKRWVDENPEKVQLIDAARTIVLATQFKSVPVSDEEIDKAYEGVSNTIYARRNIYGLGPEKSARSIGRMIRSAAIFLLVISFIFIIYRYQRESLPTTHNNEIIVKANPRGQKLSVVLPDGTKAKLNSDSRLEYPVSFSNSSRQVKLIGEAFFDVTHDKDRPFMVKTDNVTTTVLGTAFNVNAYPEAPSVEVALVEGSVIIECDSKGQSATKLVLKPNEMARIDTLNASSQVVLFNPVEVLGWKDGLLYFEKTGFKKALCKLERWYDVEFEVESESQIDPDWVFSGSFKNRSLEYVLNAFSYPDLFTFSIMDKRVKIETIN
ncbi:MAG: FecR domain-containing protein [Cytophagales bacterium]|nr:FecR domain-containing protein [Cytophagales bacterium]